MKNNIDQEAFTKYFEHLKDLLKHYSTIVAVILALSITLSVNLGGATKMPAFSKIFLVAGWLAFTVGLVLAANAIHELFIVYERVFGFDFYGRIVDDVEKSMAKISIIGSWCVSLFILGIIALGAAAVFGFR